MSWFTRLFRARALPADAPEPVDVDFVGKVVSPNTTTSPITGFTAAVMEIALVDWETVQVQNNRGFGDSNEVDRFTTLGVARFGSALVIEDAARRTLVIDGNVPLSVVPLSVRPLVLYRAPPRELFHVAQLSRHMLSYREVRFREGDAVRVVATVRAADIIVPGAGYRDGAMRTLIPVQGNRLELREMV